jgi:protein TonB
VLKFKYKPRIVDGEPIEVAGVQNKITFQLEDT